jgi:hypothetical protein
MREVNERFRRQADWQRLRQALSWPEKIHMAERIREDVAGWRATGPTASDSPAPRPSAGTRDT